MEKKKIDKVIEAFRNYKSLKEEMMSTQSTDGKPGFSEKSPSEGPTAGYSYRLGSKKVYARGGLGSRKRWLDYLKNK